MTEPTPEQIAWAAGLFEGEGCVCIGRHATGKFTTEIGRKFITLQLATTDLDVLERFMEIVGTGAINERLRYAEQGYKRQWRWTTRNHGECARIMDMLYEYMGGRRRNRIDEARTILVEKFQQKQEHGRAQLRRFVRYDEHKRDASGRFIAKEAA